MHPVTEDNEYQEHAGRRRLMAGCLLFAAALVSLGSLALVWRLGPRQELVDDAASTSTPAATATSEFVQPPGRMPLSGRVVFINEQGQIGTVDSAGEEARLLTAGSRLFLFPAWSPAASRIAAIGVGESGAGVFTFADEEDAEAAELYFDGEQAPIYLYWSPDGEQVSFIAQHEEGLGLFLAPARDSAESRLLTAGQPLYWDWSGGGERVLVHSGSSGPQARLALLDVADVEVDERQPRENLATPGFFQAPGFSAAGRYMAYAEVDETDERWLVIEEVASGETQRAPHAGAVAFGWSPAQEQLAFISPDAVGEEGQIDFYGPLRLMDAASGEVRVLAAETVIAFFWSPDGETIAYLTVTHGSGEQIAEMAGALKPVALGRQAAQQDGIRFTLWLAQVSSGQVQRVMDFQPGRLFVTQFLPFFDQYGLSHRIWSPDSAALVLPIREGRRSRIYVITRDGGRFWAVAEGQIAFWSPR